MSYKHHIRKLLWNFGFDLSRFTPELNSLARRRELFRMYKIDLVLDVGANTGQFAAELRSDIGYRGRMVSFEPMSREYDELDKSANDDPLWETRNFALGDADETASIHVAENSLSSSLLEMKQAHIDAAPESKYTTDESIEVRRLDSIFADIHRDEKNILLKIDTQGFESRVLRGAENSLRSINTLQLEMSVVPVYESEMLFSEMIAFVGEKGFYLARLDEVFTDPKTGQLLQVDGFFHRSVDHP
ncbi:MAG: FkbM family methyltransferase [Pyrinomonadaceae bacterium]